MDVHPVWSFLEVSQGLPTPCRGHTAVPGMPHPFPQCPGWLPQGCAGFTGGKGKRNLLTVPLKCEMQVTLLVSAGFRGLPAGLCCLQSHSLLGFLPSQAVVTSFHSGFWQAAWPQHHFQEGKWKFGARKLHQAPHCELCPS